MNKRIVRRGYKRNANNFDQAMTLPYNFNKEPPMNSMGLPDIVPDGLLRREYAWRKADIMSEVAVPVCLAGGYAIIGASAGALLANMAGTDPMTASTVGALVTGAVAYAIITKRQLQSLWAIEEYGEEESEERPALPRPTQHVQIEVTEMRNGRAASMRFLDLPISDKQLARMAMHLVGNGKNFSRDAMSHILSKSEYPEVKRKMLSAGLLREIDRKGTAELTAAGKALLHKLLPSGE